MIVAISAGICTMITVFLLDKGWWHFEIMNAQRIAKHNQIVADLLDKYVLPKRPGLMCCLYILASFTVFAVYCLIVYFNSQGMI